MRIKNLQLELDNRSGWVAAEKSDMDYTAMDVATVDCDYFHKWTMVDNHNYEMDADLLYIYSIASMVGEKYWLDFRISLCLALDDPSMIEFAIYDHILTCTDTAVTAILENNFIDPAKLIKFSHCRYHYISSNSLSDDPVVNCFMLVLQNSMQPMKQFDYSNLLFKIMG